MVAGFAHAPFTKGLILILSTTTLVASLFQLKPYIHLQLSPHIFVHHQYYRLVSQHCAFTNSSEVLLTLILLYNAGVKVERLFGTRKYAAFVVVVTAVCTGVQVVLLALGVMVYRGQGQSWVAQGRGPAGPFALVFSIVYQYCAIVPHLWSFQVGNLTLTDQHMTVCSLAILLSISQSTSTVFASFLGIAVSFLYHSTPLQEYRIPLRLYRVLSLLSTPWIGPTTAPQRSWRAEMPIRRTLQAREARLAQHQAAVASVSATAGGRLASLLRRTTVQGQARVVQQQRPTATPRPPAAATRAGAGATQRGWNDIPPPQVGIQPAGSAS